MTIEIQYLSYAALFTALMWAPYIMVAMVTRGVWATLDNPRADAAPLPAWAERARRAHANAVENLVVFAALVLAASAAGVTNETTALAATVYLWARVAHYVVYVAGVPVVRTLAFLVGFGCQAAIALALL